MTLTAHKTVPRQRTGSPPAPAARTTGSRPPLAHRYGLAALLAGTALLYLWNLADSGWANAYYSAAAQAGSRNGAAFFFGSLDAANSITVDKTPASLWLMGLSVRLFGLSPWSILGPQALMGVASVGVLYATVRRWYGDGAALLAGTVLALTPVAVLMFRYNNPDALLTLLLTLAAYACVRAIETGAARWVVLIGVLVGLAFLAKMLQALLVVPGFALAYLVAGPGPLGRRFAQLLGGGLALVGSAGWWVAAVDVVPEDRRPFLGGSQTNSAIELTFGYNGLGRLNGDEAGAIGNWWGYTGIDRLFSTEFGTGIAWLLPAAVGLLVAGLVVTRRAPRPDRTRAGFLVWGGWLLTTWLTFSFMAGIYHAYYNVVLAPAIGALVGMGVTVLWRRGGPWGRFALAAVLSVTAAWSTVLLGRRADFALWLLPVVLSVGVGTALLLVVVTVVSAWDRRARTRLTAGLLGLGLAAGLAGPAAYSVATAATPHEGALPKVGPPSPLGGPAPDGGLVDATRPSPEVVNVLLADADRYTWVAATVGANNAAGYQLATGRPVLALGGFNGSDPFPTLARFQELVAAGDVHYFLDSFRFHSVDGSEAAHEIAEWVQQTYARVWIGGVVFYDLTATPAAWSE